MKKFVLNRFRAQGSMAFCLWLLCLPLLFLFLTANTLSASETAELSAQGQLTWSNGPAAAVRGARRVAGAMTGILNTVPVEKGTALGLDPAEIPIRTG